jgi:hypothetical protein
MRTKRAPFDLAFFSGVFLSLESVASGWLWWNASILGRVNGVSVAAVQQDLLLAGLALIVGSLFGMWSGFSSDEKKLPSKRLTIDFMFLIGAFLTFAGLSMAVCVGACSIIASEVSRTFLFVGFGIYGASIYFWLTEKKRASGLRWEVLSTVGLTVLALDTFMNGTGEANLSLQLGSGTLIIGVVCLIALITGVLFFFRTTKSASNDKEHLVVQ